MSREGGGREELHTRSSHSISLLPNHLHELLGHLEPIKVPVLPQRVHVQERDPVSDWQLLGNWVGLAVEEEQVKGGRMGRKRGRQG